MGSGSLLNLVLRFVFSWVDAIISKLITTIYGLFSDLSQLVLYNENMVKVLGQRIGLILGVFMLFKLAISLISYLISPDKLSDSSKGGGKLIINVAISLALLITINPIFKTAYKVQGVIVESRIIERIFFGKSGVLQNKNSTTGNAVKMDIGYYLYTGFIPPNSDIFGDTCDRIWDASYDITLKDDPNSKSCDELLYQIMDDDARKSIYKARNTLDMSYIFKDYSLIMEYPQSMVPAFDYTPIISHVSGIVVLLVLISFSMELAKRAIKLLFLQIIAPIPIISNMDINKGQDIFKKWGKECINTYLSIFIRLIAINFAVFMIVLLRGNYKSVFANNVWLNIALIVGCLMFAKDVPGLIEELLGIKLNGMSLHPLKKFQEQALFGKQITSGIAGLTAGTLAGAAAMGTNLVAGINDFGSYGKGFKNRMRALGNVFGSSIAGATSASFRGLGGTLKGKKFGEVYKGAYGGAMTARTNRDDRNDLKINAFDVLGQNVLTAMHMSNNAQKYESKLKHLDDYVNSGTAVKQRAEGEIDKKADMIKYNGKSLGALRDYYDQLKNNAPLKSDSVEAIRNDIKSRVGKNRGESDGDYENRINSILASNQALVDAHFKAAQEAHAEETSKAHAAYFKARKAITNAYVENGGNLNIASITNGSGDVIDGFDSAFDGAYRDEIVESNIHKMETLNSAYGMGQPVDRSNIGATIQSADDARTAIRGSDDYGKSQLIQQQAQKEKH